MSTSELCSHCKGNKERVTNLKEVIESMNTLCDELEMEREIARVEVKDLRQIVQNNLKIDAKDSPLKEAVKVFRQSVKQEQHSEPEESKSPDSGGKRIVIRRKKKTPEVKRRSPTYWHPALALDELDQALNDVAVLQGELLQLKTVNEKLKEMYTDAEVKHTIAQFKISKLEKAKRELLLDKSNYETQAVLQKLNERKSNASLTGSPQVSGSKMINGVRITDNDMESSLLNAAKVGDLTTVSVLCERSVKEDDEESRKNFMNCRNEDGWTPLMLASARGHLPVVKKLLASGGDAKLTESDLDYTALHLAAWNNRGDIVKYLIEEANCPPDSEGEYKRTPLMLAANWGASGSMKVLLELGASPKHEDSRGRTALHWARDKVLKSTLEEAMKKADEVKNKTVDGSSDDYPFHKNISELENEV